MMTFALALTLACGPRQSGPLFIPAPVVVPMQMPTTTTTTKTTTTRTTSIGTAVSYRAVRVVPMRTVTKTVTRSAFRPLRTVGMVFTPWRW